MKTYDLMPDFLVVLLQKHFCWIPTGNKIIANDRLYELSKFHGDSSSDRGGGGIPKLEIARLTPDMVDLFSSSLFGS